MALVAPARGIGEIADRIRERRGGELSPLDDMLLHNEAFADGWNKLLGAVRTGMDLPGDIRELVICRIAALNGAEYEWRAHAPLAAREGLTEEQITALREGGNTALLSDSQRCVLAYTDAMTRQIVVSDELSSTVLALLGTKQLVELTGTIASYNMVSRFLIALRVGTQTATLDDKEHR
jgi:alkylhydroperoxidase family enzyme